MEARVAYTVNEAVLYIHSGELDPGPGEQATSLGLFFSKKTPISPAFSFWSASVSMVHHQRFPVLIHCHAVPKTGVCFVSVCSKYFLLTGESFFNILWMRQSCIAPPGNWTPDSANRLRASFFSSSTRRSHRRFLFGALASMVHRQRPLPCCPQSSVCFVSVCPSYFLLTRKPASYILWMRPSCIAPPGNWTPVSANRLRASDFFSSKKRRFHRRFLFWIASGSGLCPVPRLISEKHR